MRGVWVWRRTVVAALVWASAALAASAGHLPIISTKIIVPERGVVGPLSGTLEATNTGTRDVYVSLALQGTAPGERPLALCSSFPVPAGQTKPCAFTLTLTGAALQTTRLIVAAEIAPGQTKLEAHPYELYFTVENNAFARRSYKDVFMRDCVAGRAGCALDSAKVLDVDDAPELEAAVPFPAPSPPATVIAPPEPPLGTPALPGAKFNVSGRLTYLDLARLKRPAWGWRVQLHWLRPLASSQSQAVHLGTQTLYSNGAWQIAFQAPAGYSGQNLRITYAPENPFVEFLADIKTSSGAWVQRPYRLTEPLIRNIPQRFKAPTTLIDMSRQGQYAGLGDVFRYTMRLLNALKQAGMIDDSFGLLTEVVFPNEHEFCGGDEVWSCQDGDRLWVHANHAGTPFTMLHELGHAVQWRFWNDFPPNSGGRHGFYSCGSKGMALSEGVASAIMAMVDIAVTEPEAALNVDGPPIPFVVPLEAPKYVDLEIVGDCTGSDYSGSELAVAATIWDLMDHHIDDRNARSDADHYRLAYLPLYLILTNGAKASLGAYKQTLKNQAGANAGWIDDVFEMNDMR